MIGKEILNYRIISQIGTGGMGSVYLAEHTLISEQKVAIKVINANMVNDFTRDLLKKEAKRLASLKHQNIVTFHNYHIDKEGNVYLVMEYADGKSLEDYINNVNGLIVEERIYPLFAPILDAVGYAHKKGILHRDIKPANIIVGPDGNPKILDFGIAEIIKNDADGESEEETVIMGTPSYMSPEQVKGEKLDERSDIYSLGVLLHQMLTGNAPYDTTTLTEQEINQKVVEEKLPRMKTYYKYVSDKVQAVVDKATAKNPSDRYKNTDEFKKALHKAIYPWRPKLWQKIAAVLLLLVIAGGAWWIWDYNRIKTRYFKDYTEQWGVPVGIGKLSSNEHSHRAYRFIYQKGKLLRVSHVNSLGNLIDDTESERNNRPVDQEFFYTADGNIHRIKVKDRSGKVLYVKNYNDKLNTMTFLYDDEHGTERTLGKSTVGYGRLLENDGREKSRISRYWLEYDDNGYVVSEKFADMNNTQVCDEHGIYGRSYIRDEKGRPVEIRYIGVDGEPQSTKWGLGIKTFEYDTDDNWVKSQYLTVDRMPALDDADGTAVYELEYDKFGNVTTALHKDADGNLMYPKKYNVAGFKNTYDDKGFIVREEFLDIDRNPMFVVSAGFAIRENQYDENGYVSKSSVFDPDGIPVEDKSGVASIILLNDANGNQLEQWNYGIDKELTLNNSGWAGIILTYDDRGNILSEIYYDTEKQPCINELGVAGYRYEFNDKNLQTKYICLDTDMHPATNYYGFAVCKLDYDKRGNQTKVSYYDADEENLVITDYGYAGYNSVYDDSGYIIEENYFDDKGKPVLSPSMSYAKIVYEYDENGNKKSERYYNAEGEPTSVNGVVGYNYISDRSGNPLETFPVGQDGKQASDKLVLKYKYDDMGNVIECAFYDEGKPDVNYNNIHAFRYKYNDKRQCTETARYDTEDQLVAGMDDNWAIKRDEYDGLGNITRSSYFGADGRPCMSTEGWSSSTKEYDAIGNLIRQCFFGTDGKPLATTEFPPVGIARYDKWGNVVYVAAQNEDSEFILNPMTGWSICRYEYDNKGHVLSELYFDTKDKPMLCGGVHKYTYSYDQNGHLSEKAAFGTSGQPVAVNNVHKEAYKYDGRGNRTHVLNIDINGRPVDDASGIYRYEITYTPDGNYDTLRTYQADGELIGTMKWDGSQWAVLDRPFDIKTGVRGLNAELPIDAEIFVVERVNVTGSRSCDLVCRMSYTADNFSSEELKEIKQMVENYTSIVNDYLENKATVTGILYDKNGGVIFRKTI